MVMDGTHMAALVLLHAVLPARDLRNKGDPTLLTAAVDQGIVDGLVAILATCAVASTQISVVSTPKCARQQLMSSIRFACQSLVEITAVPAQAKAYFHGTTWAYDIAMACAQCCSIATAQTETCVCAAQQVYECLVHVPPKRMRECSA